VTYRRQGAATVAASFDVVDVASGENIKPKRLKCDDARETHAVDEEPPAIDGQAMLDHCSTKIVADFMKAIAPWQDFVDVPFKKDGDLPSLERGIGYARAGQWSDAIASFQEGSPASSHNTTSAKST
jgi:hypothetical protein